MLTEGPARVNIFSPAAQALICLFRFKEEGACLFGQRLGDDDAEGVFGDEGGDAPDVRAERVECRGGGLVVWLGRAEGGGGAAEGPAEAVEGEVTAGEDFPARLKLAEGVEDEARGVVLARRCLHVEE